jgi:hypothetical protein
MIFKMLYHGKEDFRFYLDPDNDSIEDEGGMTGTWRDNEFFLQTFPEFMDWLPER